MAYLRPQIMCDCHRVATYAVIACDSSNLVDYACAACTISRYPHARAVPIAQYQLQVQEHRHMSDVDEGTARDQLDEK